MRGVRIKNKLGPTPPRPWPRATAPDEVSLDPWTGRLIGALAVVDHGVAGGRAGTAGLPSVSTEGPPGQGCWAGWTGSGCDGWWQAVADDAVPQGEPGLRPGPVLGQVQDGAALRLGETGRHVDQRAAQGRAAGHGLLDRRGLPAARSRLWVIATHRAQAAFAANRPDGRCASGPSIRSAKVVSMIAWRRWMTSATDRGLGAVGEEPVVPPDREQLIEAGPGHGPGARSAGR